MIKPIFRTGQQAGLVLGIAFAATLTGCNKSPAEIQYVTAPAAVAPAPATVVQVVQPNVFVQDDYVYYPSYEVYYSSNRHQYLYLDGGAWVTRSAPPRVSIDVLFASPSVRLDVHDSPERHHEVMMRSYPRNWAPPGRGHGEKDDHRDEKKDDRKDRR